MPETEKLAGSPAGHVNSSGAGTAEWEEIGVELAALALEIANGAEPNRGSLPAAEARDANRSNDGESSG
jgi:hypothetical protein